MVQAYWKHSCWSDDYRYPNAYRWTVDRVFDSFTDELCWQRLLSKGQVCDKIDLNRRICRTVWRYRASDSLWLLYIAGHCLRHIHVWLWNPNSVPNCIPIDTSSLLDWKIRTLLHLQVASNVWFINHGWDTFTFKDGPCSLLCLWILDAHELAIALKWSFAPYLSQWRRTSRRPWFESTHLSSWLDFTILASCCRLRIVALSVSFRWLL